MPRGGSRQMRRPEVWPPLPGRLSPLLFAPLCDLLVVARQKNLGYLQPLERPRSRVLRMLQKAVLKAFRTQAVCLAQHSGDQSYARLYHHHGRRLAAGENRVSDGDLLEPARVQHALIHPLETAAEDGDPVRL